MSRSFLSRQTWQSRVEDDPYPERLNLDGSVNNMILPHCSVGDQCKLKFFRFFLKFVANYYRGGICMLCDSQTKCVGEVLSVVSRDVHVTHCLSLH